MITEVPFPQMSEEDPEAEGVVGTWFVNHGETVVAGQVIADGPALYVHAGDWRTVKAATKPTPGAWCHVVAVVERGKGRIYVDGRKEGEAAVGARLPNTPAPLSIGGQRNAGEPMQFLQGAIDEVHLWNKALSEEEIRKEGGEKR